MSKIRRINILMLAGICLLLVFIVIALIGPFFFQNAANTINASNGRRPPSGEHIAGTDGFGRDVFARVIVATRLTLGLTFGSSLIAVGVGTLVGVLVWLLSSRMRSTILQLNAVAVALPSMILALVVAAIMGPGSMSAMLAVGIAGIPTYIRLTSMMSAKVVSRDFVAISELEGVSKFRQAVRHILPNIATPLSVMAANSTVFTLTELSSLSFIGLGVQSPDYDYGKMLYDGLGNMGSDPWEVLVPSLAIVLLGLSIMLFGDGLSAMVDPKVSSRIRRLTRESSRSVGGSAADSSVAIPVPDDVLVDVQNMSVGTYTDAGDRKALVNDVSFQIKKGEILGIVGESGSGKSLSAMTVAGLIPDGLWSQAKAISVDGINMQEKQDAQLLAQTLALVYQDPMATFSPSLRIGSQLGDIFRTHFGWNGKKIRESLAQSFKSVSILDPKRRLGQFPHELSGGLLQRTLIAHALLLEPRLLIADEPTTALDVSVQADVLRKIYAFRNQSHVSVLFISHDLAVIGALCDRVLVMYQGQIVEELLPEQIRSQQVKHPYTKKLLSEALYFIDSNAAQTGVGGNDPVEGKEQ